MKRYALSALAALGVSVTAAAAAAQVDQLSPTADDEFDARLLGSAVDDDSDARPRGRAIDEDPTGRRLRSPDDLALSIGGAHGALGLALGAHVLQVAWHVGPGLDGCRLTFAGNGEDDAVDLGEAAGDGVKSVRFTLVEGAKIALACAEPRGGEAADAYRVIGIAPLAEGSPDAWLNVRAQGRWLTDSQLIELPAGVALDLAWTASADAACGLEDDTGAVLMPASPNGEGRLLMPEVHLAPAWFVCAIGEAELRQPLMLANPMN